MYFYDFTDQNKHFEVNKKNEACLLNYIILHK